MKSTLIRLMTIATLATSISAFAATGETKPDAAAKATASQQQEGCATNPSEAKQQKKAKTPQHNDKNDKDFDRVLMAIYG
ncbi:MAG TPA: hypothetical protein VN872_13085 [Candidatus Acidoferrum sp.]|nr:hypothetical protein [Candidatus Acidoferrum sp.]